MLVLTEAAAEVVKSLTSTPQAPYLADKVLDAQADGDGNLHFSLGVQRPGEV